MLKGRMRIPAMAAALSLLLAIGAGAGEDLVANSAPAVNPTGLTSLRRNAVISLGGEFKLDYSYRSMRASGSDPGANYRLDKGDLMLRNLNLRLWAEVHPNLRAMFKINLTGPKEGVFPDDDILEEALLVMHSLAGGGLEIFAGKGRAPYGQDIALGMIQSYHHVANRADSNEGRIFIIDPPATFVQDPNLPNVPNARVALPPMRPGQFDRAFLAGFAYEWDTRWRVEIAAFQPGYQEYRPRLENRAIPGRDPDARIISGSDIGFAGRAWWRVNEDLLLEASALTAHSTDMGNQALRFDLANLPTAQARKNAYAVSLGFDWRRGPWRVFGEYEHAWDWNFSKGYDTDTWQLGMAREISGGWRVGAMAENLRIRDPLGQGTVDKYYKLALNVKYAFDCGVFVLAEYGHEWFRRERQGVLSDKRRGDFIGMRIGFSF